MATTLTMAGHVAHAGAARLVCGAPAPSSAMTPAAHPAAVLVASVGGYGTHQASTWTKGATAKTRTFVQIDGKNRPTRPLSELSP